MRKPATSRLQRRCRDLHHDDIGAAYSLSVVFTLPLYLAFITFSIELILLLNSSQALTAAMQTASHSARAWTVHREALEGEGGSLEQVVSESIARSMMMFSTTKNQRDAPDFAQLASVIRAGGVGSSGSQRLASKAEYIEASLRVSIIQQMRTTEGLWIRAEYDSPLWIPFFAPLLSTGRNFSGPMRTIRADSWVPLDSREIELSSLGIPYSPSLVANWP